MKAINASLMFAALLSLAAVTAHAQGSAGITAGRGGAVMSPVSSLALGPLVCSTQKVTYACGSNKDGSTMMCTKGVKSCSR